MDKEEHEKLVKAIDDGYLTEELKPLKCTSCESTEMVDDIKDTINGLASEYETKCAKCGTVLGYWAYGYWQV